MMSREKRVAMVVAQKANSRSEFCLMMGWNDERLNEVMNGTAMDGLIDILRKFEDVSARWLLFGDGFIFGSIQKAVNAKMQFLEKLSRYVPVMTEEESRMLQNAVTVPEFTDYAREHIVIWEKLLNSRK